VVSSIMVGGHAIGPGQPCFIIAEAGVNHNGDLERAKTLVQIAAAAGADAVKFQTFKADILATADAPKADYQKVSGAVDESQQDMLRRLELSAEAHSVLMGTCFECGILFMSSPFDEESADFLVGLKIPVLKIPSGEITNVAFLRHVARLRVPLIVSTGMANMEEVGLAVDVLRVAGCTDLSLLHCVSNYPADPAACNLRAMETLRAHFNVPVGFSDHTLGSTVSLAAAALGANVIEKHFTVDKTLPGPDHQASLDPTELRAFVAGIRSVEASMGDGVKKPVASEAGTAAVARKSLVASRPIQRGEILSKDNVVARRPGTGLSASHIDQVLGKRAAVALETGRLIEWRLIL